MKTLFALLTLAAALSAGEPMHTAAMAVRQPAPATAYVGLSVTSALIMWPDVAAPCVACVTGASSFTIGITSPVSTIYTNNTYKWLLTYNSDSYAGSCAASLALIRGSTVLASSTSPVMCHPFTSYVSWSTFNLPDSVGAGPAVLMGQFKSTDGALVSSVTIPVMVQ